MNMHALSWPGKVPIFNGLFGFKPGKSFLRNYFRISTYPTYLPFTYFRISNGVIFLFFYP